MKVFNLENKRGLIKSIEQLQLEIQEQVNIVEESYVINELKNMVETLGEAKSQLEVEKYKVVFIGEKYQDNDLVMCTPSGTPINPANVRRSLNALIKKAVVPKIRFHDLRHTHGTLLLAKGVNVKVISERLGHSKIKITLDTYSHVLPMMQEDAVNKIEEIL
ncbi:site-specific integrase [Bacillus cereus]|uniref:site-specific integrase n=1 Tax=Bacillus nitratireducens TaxID=2026193 RepID=UPI000BEC807C|nr:site-specific integrase [Bacillus cereus]PEQ43620.1 site-specific integrase [Bacillus cereus]PER35447.1 site-specific integrase [Bacillus cereus]PEW99270.1 site-specific integrase [Bacillus cereus]PEX95573.1 site-specific integrase [Bacillus cereus]